MADEITLGQLADIRTGYVFRSGVENDPAGDMRVVGMKDLKADLGVDWSGVVRIRSEQNLTDFLLQDGDILFTVRGARFYGVYMEKVSGRAIASHHLFHIRVRDRKVIRPTFLAWIMNRAEAQRYYAEHAMGQSSLRGLRRPDMQNLPLRLPPLAKQDEIMRAVDCMRREIELFEASKQNRLALQEALAAELC